MKPLDTPALIARRLRAQRLTGRPFESAAEVVRWMGAVQSQDFSGAIWALGQRVRGATEAELMRQFDEGAILRTHVMRPTWHFVHPEDIRWLRALTGPRIRAGLAARYRELGLDARVAGRAMAAFTSALEGGRHLTRTELGAVLRRARISPEGQRLPHLLAWAELHGVLVSGPRRGKQFTFALLEERVPKARVLDRTEALAELTRRYFRSHGPAQLQDFAWWSGLTAADIRAGIALVGTTLRHAVIEGREYWYGAGAEPAGGAAPSAHLLPNFDEYTVGYRDRSAMFHDDAPFQPGLFSFGSVLSDVAVIGGFVRGSWRHKTSSRGVRVEVRLLRPLAARELAALEGAARRMGRFLERPVEIVTV